MAVSFAGAGLLFVNFRRGDPVALAALAVVILLGLRGAWKSDRQIQLCDAQIQAKAKTHP
jgi:hypothetical protein